MKFEEVKELIAIFEETDLNDMEVELDNAVVRLNRGRAVHMPAIPQPPVFQAQGAETVFMAGKANAPATAAFPAGGSLSMEQMDKAMGGAGTEEKAKEDGKSGGKFIKAPIVGTFYQSASPEKPPYVNVGDTVSKGDIVCIIEAMKFMNEVTSEENGKIAEVLVEDGQFVEFGEPLFRLE